MSRSAIATDRASPAVIEAGAPESQDLPVAQPAWDPYDVWLKRVQQPRERAARSRRDDAPSVPHQGWMIRV
jgi:hypothetical protein